MEFSEQLYKVEFVNSKEKAQISLKELGDCSIGFLRCCDAQALGPQLRELLEIPDSEGRFRKLLQKTGYGDDPKNFFGELLTKIERTNDRDFVPMEINGIAIPYLMTLGILELLVPGQEIFLIKSVEKLEQLTNVRIPAREERVDLQKVIVRYPVRLSSHIVRQMRLSKAVAYQYLPFAKELDSTGHLNTWIGQYHRGLLERMYENRVIFVLNMTCPVYCRFCFRKHKECRNQRPPRKKDVQEALDYIKTAVYIKEIVLTGGDPFMNRATMNHALDGLMEIPHLQTLRLATRSIAYYPDLFRKDDSAWIYFLKMKNLMLRKRGKRLEVATHFIHPEEISPDSLEIISELTNSGIKVYIQTPFLNECNDKGPELTALFSKLRGAGAEIHYLYIPCSPIQGNSLYWTPLSAGIDVSKFLRANLSDRAIPKICTATRIGKIDWNTSGWAVEQSQEPDNIWIRTPYTREYIESFAELRNSDFFRENSEGTLDIKFMGKIGDPGLFLGPRKTSVTSVLFPWGELKDSLDEFQKSILRDQRIPLSIVNTGYPSLYRPHKTMVEMDVAISGEELEKNLAYIKNNEKITDVILSSKLDAIEHLSNLGKIIYRIREIEHVNAIRLRSMKFNFAPEAFSRVIVDKLGSFNNLSIVNPKRLEIETQFFHSSQIKDTHKKLVDLFHEKGVTVYCNTPLMAGINDSKEEMQKIAFSCRRVGIEFHQVLVSGLPFQKEWSKKHRTNLSILIDIATYVRRNGSGREVPHYVLYTELGPVDFNLNSKLTKINGHLYLKCLPYDLEYFKEMQPDYSWPEGVITGDGRKPAVLLENAIINQDFLLQEP